MLIKYANKITQILRIFSQNIFWKKSSKYDRVIYDIAIDFQ